MDVVLMSVIVVDSCRLCPWIHIAVVRWGSLFKGHHPMFYNISRIDIQSAALNKPSHLFFPSHFIEVVVVSNAGCWMLLLSSSLSSPRRPSLIDITLVVFSSLGVCHYYFFFLSPRRSKINESTSSYWSIECDKMEWIEIQRSCFDEQTGHFISYLSFLIWGIWAIEAGLGALSIYIPPWQEPHERPSQSAWSPSLLELSSTLTKDS